MQGFAGRQQAAGRAGRRDRTAGVRDVDQEITGRTCACIRRVAERQRLGVSVDSQRTGLTSLRRSAGT
jgi:hypothetical protein